MHSLSTKIFPKTKRGGAKNGHLYIKQTITYSYNFLHLKREHNNYSTKAVLFNKNQYL